MDDFVQDRDRFVGAIRDAGPWGLMIYVVLMMILVAVGVPGLAFVIPATVLWSSPTAIGVFLAGGMAASAVRFFFVRALGRSWVEPRLPETFRRWDARLEEGGFWTVVVMRLLFNLAAPADWILALSRVNVRRFLAGTLVGRTPVAIVWVLFGGSFLGWLADAPPAVWAVVAAAAVMSTVVSRRRAPRHVTPLRAASPAVRGTDGRRL